MAAQPQPYAGGTARPRAAPPAGFWEVPGIDGGGLGPLPKPAFDYRFSLPGETIRIDF